VVGTTTASPALWSGDAIASGADNAVHVCYVSEGVLACSWLLQEEEARGGWLTEELHLGLHC
jgi:hypothetical protein